MVTCRARELSEADFVFLTLPEFARTPSIPAGMSLNDMEKQLIVATLQRTNGNIKESAAMLGIDRSTLYEKIKKYEIPR